MSEAVLLRRVHIPLVLPSDNFGHLNHISKTVIFHFLAHWSGLKQREFSQFERWDCEKHRFKMVAAWSVRWKLLRQPKTQNYNSMLDLTVARACIQAMIFRFFCVTKGNLGQLRMVGQIGSTLLLFYSLHFLYFLLRDHRLRLRIAKSFGRAASVNRLK